MANNRRSQNLQPGGNRDEGMYPDFLHDQDVHDFCDVPYVRAIGHVCNVNAISPIYDSRDACPIHDVRDVCFVHDARDICPIKIL
jgi:hypothetical protein